MAKDLRLLLARHGQTEHNSQGRFQGSSDTPLSEEGRAQAAALAARLANEPIAAIYTSDLQRARLTAESIAQHHACELVVDPRLREMNFGQWEGLTYEEIAKRNPFKLAWWELNKLKSSPPDGEKLTDFFNRVEQGLNEIKRQHDEQSVLVVAHGGVLKMILCQVLKLSPRAYWQFELSTASLSEVTIYPPGGIIRGLNDTNHLEEPAWAS